MSTSVGFVGLGTMGRPMARRLLEHGYALTVHNRSPEAVAVLEEAGALPASSPAGVAERAEVVCTMLPTEEALAEVALGADGIAARARPGLRLVDLSTVSPATIRSVAARLGPRVRVLDAPVSGGEQGAVEGSLSIMIGGEAADVEAVIPVLRAMGRTIVHAGPLGAGQTVKAANQVLVAGIIQSVAEAVELLDASGADTAAGLEALAGGLGGNRLLELRRLALLARDFRPGGRVALHRKDLGIALALGRRLGVYLPVTAAVDQLFTALAALGFDHLDHTALLKLEDLLAGRRSAGSAPAGGASAQG